MKIRAGLLSLFLFVLATTHASSWIHGGAEIPFNGGLSQGQSYSPAFSGDYAFINLLKTASDWFTATPSQADSNGYPIDSTAGASGAFGTTFNSPGQTERPGNQVITWLGSGRVGEFYQTGGSGQSVAACTGTAVSGFSCNNTACGSLTGSITGKVLTVTVAPGCSL